MTNKQAVDLIHACMHVGNIDILEARDKACVALDRQEFKKVLNIKTSVKDIFLGELKFTGNCPNCNDWVDNISNENFCGRCGQALDWEIELW